MIQIFHIALRDDVEAANIGGEYSPPTFSDEGFIHCSYADQVIAVARRYYHGQNGLVLLEIDRSSLSCDVIDENLIGGDELYPHIYGRLPMSAVTNIHAFPCRADGTFLLPPAIPEIRSQ